MVYTAYKAIYICRIDIYLDLKIENGHKSGKKHVGQNQHFYTKLEHWKWLHLVPIVEFPVYLQLNTQYKYEKWVHKCVKNSAYSQPPCD